jgi:transposase-like protein
MMLRWLAVKCPVCGRHHCMAAPGSMVRWRCKLCKRFRVVTV